MKDQASGLAGDLQGIGTAADGHLTKRSARAPVAGGEMLRVIQIFMTDSTDKAYIPGNTEMLDKAAAGRPADH